MPLRSNFEPGTSRWATRRAQWRALGLTDEDMVKPKIAIVNSSSQLAIWAGSPSISAWSVPSRRAPCCESQPHDSPGRTEPLVMAAPGQPPRCALPRR